PESGPCIYNPLIIEQAMSTRWIPFTAGGILALTLALAGGWRIVRIHGADGPDILPRGFPIASPHHPILPMVMREDYSDELTQSLATFAEHLRTRDRAGAIAWLSPRFAGESLRARAGETVDLGLGTTLERDAPDARPVLDMAGFIDSFDERVKD